MGLSALVAIRISGPRLNAGLCAGRIHATLTQLEGAGNVTAHRARLPALRWSAIEHEISPRALMASEQENVQSRLRSAAQSARAEDTPEQARFRTISKAEAARDGNALRYPPAFEAESFEMG